MREICVGEDVEIVGQIVFNGTGYVNKVKPIFVGRVARVVKVDEDHVHLTGEWNCRRRRLCLRKNEVRRKGIILKDVLYTEATGQPTLRAALGMVVLWHQVYYALNNFAGFKFDTQHVTDLWLRRRGLANGLERELFELELSNDEPKTGTKG